ncbi:polysulfide reductase NrfD [Nocardioides sp. LMS-CY]|uniref:NrfD/PsrC family molybdoenzyme membrane anchor subunit n=1 Tax=Nocardioides sp. (strain LMS-CY) TaxID=2840457 RepID=UPI001C006718|nr:NrfD/PsrC family molybdoenzyme membrane anchor subunit [Nocardioides sp. LMS-CY]QWF20567.1 polysulfide reductase NrfD [Nocardioides sp. LMS-CY]
MARGEAPMVPPFETPRSSAPQGPSSFESYYGRQIIKTPTWKTPDVPLYLFLGGLAGCSAVLAEGAALSGRPELERVTRLAAAGGAAAGTVALVHDLGRPERFLNMLRVLKPTSPLSVGSFILAPFSALSGAAAASHVTGLLPRLGRLAGVGAGVLGPPLATYTAALLGNTVVPAWHEAHRELPFVFGGSGAQAAGGLAMMLVPLDQAGPARRMALAGAAVEIAAAESIVLRRGLVAEPYQVGTPGRLMRIARNGTAAASAATLLLGRRSRLASAVAGATYVAASVTTRFGIFEAGLASARDPKYTVVPQRERVARQGGSAKMSR